MRASVGRLDALGGARHELALAALAPQHGAVLRVPGRDDAGLRGLRDVDRPRNIVLQRLLRHRLRDRLGEELRHRVGADARGADAAGDREDGGAGAMWTVPVILCFNASFVIASETASARNCDIVSVPTPEAPTPPAIARTVGPAPERNAP